MMAAIGYSTTDRAIVLTYTVGCRIAVIVKRTNRTFLNVYFVLAQALFLQIDLR